MYCKNTEANWEKGGQCVVEGQNEAILLDPMLLEMAPFKLKQECLSSDQAASK